MQFAVAELNKSARDIWMSQRPVDSNYKEDT